MMAADRQFRLLHGGKQFSGSWGMLPTTEAAPLFAQPV